MEEVTDRLPYPMVGLDCDNGGEFINHALIAWCAERTIFMTRARAHTSHHGPNQAAITVLLEHSTPDRLSQTWERLDLRVGSAS